MEKTLLEQIYFSLNPELLELLSFPGYFIFILIHYLKVCTFQVSSFQVNAKMIKALETFLIFISILEYNLIFIDNFKKCTVKYNFNIFKYFNFLLNKALFIFKFSLYIYNFVVQLILIYTIILKLII